MRPPTSSAPGRPGSGSGDPAPSPRLFAPIAGTPLATDLGMGRFLEHGTAVGQGIARLRDASGSPPG